MANDYYRVYGGTVTIGGRVERWVLAYYDKVRLPQRIDGNISEALKELAWDIVHRTWDANRIRDAKKTPFSVTFSYDTNRLSEDESTGMDTFALTEEQQRRFGEHIHEVHDKLYSHHGVQPGSTEASSPEAIQNSI